MGFKNYYDTLGLKPTASQDEIKQAFRKLSIKFHPDKNNGDTFLEEMFKNINEAHEILSDTSKRKDYNKTLDNVNSTFTKSYQESYKSEQHHQMQEEFIKMFDLIKVHFDNESIVTNKYLALLNAQYIPKPKYVTAPKILWTVLIILGVSLIFRPKTDNTINNEQYTNTSSYEWITKKNAKVYSNPDIHSSIIGDIPSGTVLKSIDETKYFIKVTYNDNNGNEIEGYIRKKLLKKN